MRNHKESMVLERIRVRPRPIRAYPSFRDMRNYRSLGWAYMSKLPGYFRILLPSRLDTRFMALSIALLGVISDWITTQVGLGMGYYETHLMYHPVLALAIIWTPIMFLLMVLPRDGRWDYAIYFIASWSFIGAVNNILVIMGIFSGWVI